jgi:hypothetical protein
LEVVDLEAMAHSAARHAALRVAEQHGAGDLGGEGAGALPDVEHGSCFVDEDGLDRRAGPKLLEEGVGDGDAGDLGGSAKGHGHLEVRSRGKVGRLSSASRSQRATSAST